MVEVLAGVGAIAPAPVRRCNRNAESVLEISRAVVIKAVHQRLGPAIVIAVDLSNGSVKEFVAIEAH